MSHVTEYVSEVRASAGRFGSSMPKHQRLVYAVEGMVENIMPSATLSLDGARALVDTVCADLEVDTPEVIVKALRGFGACASHRAWTIVLSTDITTAMTVLHELAHLLSNENEGHHEQWRSTFVRLVRRYISVEHGALLHTLYNRCDLPTAWS